MSGDDSQYIWIVNKDGCSVVVGKFMESESIPAFDLIFVRQYIIFVSIIVNSFN